MKQKLLLIIACANLAVFANASQSQNKPKVKLNPGRDRMFTIMYEGEHGISEYNQKITFAETQNLFEDVNIPLIALYFPTKTDIGQTFLLDTISSVVSPKDTNSTVQRRQKVIEFLSKNTALQQEINILLQEARTHELAVIELLTNRAKVLERLKMPDDALIIDKPWYSMTNWMARNPYGNTASQVWDALYIPAYILGGIESAMFAYESGKNVWNGKTPRQIEIAKLTKQEEKDRAKFDKLREYDTKLQNDLEKTSSEFNAFDPNVRNIRDQIKQNKIKLNENYENLEATIENVDKQRLLETKYNPENKGTTNIFNTEFFDPLTSASESLSKAAQSAYNLELFNTVGHSAYALGKATQFSGQATAIVPIFSKDTIGALGGAGAAITAGVGLKQKTSQIYKDYQKSLRDRELIHALNRLVAISEQLNMLCKKHSIETQFSINSINNPKGLALIEGFKHPRYENAKEEIVISTPWINTFIVQIYEDDVYLAPLFASIAEMDSYNAIAAKIIELQGARNKLCIAQVLQQARPKFESKGFWNVVVPNPIPNTLIEDHNIIITGPNTGGKSTVIRSILQNIILSQTYGFATGEFFASTPYDVIYSSLKISDDISKGLSRYASELKRGNDIVIRAKALRHDEKFFFVLDELFTGTNARDGEIAAYELVNDDLAPYFKYIQFIFATHYDKLKLIETANPAYFANYKIDAPIINAQGKSVYPYTLSRGVSNISTALDLKKEAGLSGKNEPSGIGQNPPPVAPPAQPTPVTPTPVKPTPVKPAPVQAKPIQVKPITTTPVQSRPTTTPAKPVQKPIVKKTINSRTGRTA